MSKPIYFDYAAATPVADDVLAAMRPYFAEQFYNPSATYLAAKRARATLDSFRADVAAVIGSRPAEVTFTAGGSEANNLAIHGVMRGHPKANIVVSAIEHDSVMAAAGHYEIRYCPVDEAGLVDPTELQSLIDDNTVLVSVMYANNEIGTVQPLREIGLRLAELRTARRAAGNRLPLLFHSDAAQAANYLDVHVSRLGVDLMTLNGGKLYGPKQSGALYIRGGIVLEPLIDGGGQEHGLRSGTENLAAAAGFATALAIAQATRKNETARLQTLQQDCLRRLVAAIPDLRVNGSRKHRLPNNVHITMPGTDNERLIMQLDEAGIMAAAGSACSASSELPSHVLTALGLSDDTARSSLRFTFGRGTSAPHIDRLVDELTRLLA